MVRLTSEELSFFKTWGYVLKKSVLPQPLIDTALGQPVGRGARGRRGGNRTHPPRRDADRRACCGRRPTTACWCRSHTNGRTGGSGRSLRR